MKRIIAAAAVLCTLLCGCDSYSDYIEPENRLLISAIGIDKHSGEIKLSAEAVTVKKNSSNDAHGKTMLSATGKTVQKAVLNLKSDISGKLSLGHCAIVIFGNGVGGETVNEIFKLCFTDADIRSSVRLAAAENAESLLKTDGDEQAGYKLCAMFAENRELPSAGCDCTVIRTINSEKKQNGVFALPLFDLQSEQIAFKGMVFYKSNKEYVRITAEQAALLQAALGRKHHGELALGDEVINAASIKRTESKDNITLKIRLKSSVTATKYRRYERSAKSALEDIFSLLPSEAVPSKQITVKVTGK